MSKPTSAPPPAWGLVPLFFIAVAFGTGIWLADWLGYTPSFYWLTAALLVGVLSSLTVFLPSAAFWPARWGTLGILLTCLLLGGWRTTADYLPAHPDFFLHQQRTDDFLTGEIDNIRPGEKNLRLEVTLTHLLHDSLGDRNVRGRLLLYLPPTVAAAQLREGEEIVFSGQPKNLRPPLNPYVFDLSAYWSRQGVYHQLFLRTDADWRATGRSNPGFSATAERWRRAWFRTFQDHLAGDELAVAAALVMGKRDGISQEVKSAYADTGAIHVLAVSGLHVGIIFLIVQTLLLRVFRLGDGAWGRVAVAVLSTLAVWIFALVSGFSTSVFRAAIMFTVLAAAGLRKQRVDIFNTLSVAALVILWLHPQELFQIGFQLSFSAIVGIVLFTPKLNRLVYWSVGVLRKMWSAMAASTGAQLGTLPLSLFHFGRFPTYFLLSGTVVIISAFAAMFGGLLHGLVASLLPEAVAGLTGSLLSFIIEVQNAFIFYFQRLPYALLEVSHFGWQPALLLAISLGALAVFLRWRRGRVLLLSGLVLLVCLIWARTQVPGKNQEDGLLVYHRSRGTLIDVIVNKHAAFAFGTEPSAKDLPWTAGPRREALDYQPTLTLGPDHRDTVLTEELAYSEGVIRYQNHQLFILDGAQRVIVATLPDELTHLLVVNNFRPTHLPEIPEGVTVIVDGSNPYYRYAAWRELAAEKGFRCWVTGEDGAYKLPE